MGQSLIANLALVALVVSCWNHAQSWLEAYPRALRQAAFACVMGCGAVISMMLAVPLEPGVIFDLRSSLLAVAGFFGGPEAALVAGTFAAAYRALIGGHGMSAGLIGIGTVSAIGALGHALMRGRSPALFHILGLAAAVSLATVFTFWALPAPVRGMALNNFGAAISLLNFAATTLAALAIVHMLSLAAERQLLRAALTQAPDFQFVKNKRGEFVAVNQTVAEHNGFRHPAQMRGRTDFDITSPGRAHKLFVDEQQVLASGEPLIDREEKITTVDGAVRWFSTSKSPLRDSDGRVIGLAGVTRDVTRRKQAEAALVSNRHQFVDALAEISDGLATFDAQGCLTFFNRQFAECFPLSPGAYLPNLHAVDFFKAVAETGRPQGVEPESAGAWARASAEAMLCGGEREIALGDLRWIRLRSRPLREGGATLIVSDVTRRKEADRMLDAFAASLEVLGERSAVSGVLARRAFDQDLRTAQLQAAALKRSLGTAA